jgi:adenylate kinase family enzyme
MRRVLIIGAGGAGKTTVARRLAATTGLPLIHLDSLYWRPGWVATPPDEWEATVRELVRQDAWIMDGNYGGTLDLRLEACDTVVFLDFPRLVCLARVLSRQVRHRGEARAELPAGCPERFSWGFYWWIWTYRGRRRGAILERLAAFDRSKRVLVLRSQGEVEGFLASPA